MVWGGIHLHGRPPLHLIQGNLTGVRYRDEIIWRIVLLTLQAMGPGAILQDDNATPHRARVVTGFLQQHQVTQMDWPARSPDLAPIENLWDIPGRRVHDNHPQQQTSLSCSSSFSRSGMPSLNRLVALVQSMRKRCVECLTANGGFTHYSSKVH